MYRPVLGVFCFFAGLIATTDLPAQDYHWHCTLPMRTYCVAFNPLSKGRVLFTSTPYSQSILRSEDGGEHWHSSMPLDVATPVIHQIYCLPSDTNIVFALSSGAFHQTPTLYRSTDGGESWTSTSGLGGIDGEAIAYNPTTDALYYGENFAGVVYRSVDHGASWIKLGIENTSVTLCSLGVSPDSNKVLLAGSEAGVVDLSSDEGQSWNVVFKADTVQNPEVPKVIFSEVAPTVAFATRWHSAEESLVTTRDRGFTWSKIASPDPHVWAFEIDQRRAACPNNVPLHLWTGLFTQYAPDTSAGGMIEESTDGGYSWHSTGFPRIAQPPSVWVIKFDTSSGSIAAATDSGLFIGHEEPMSVLGEPATYQSEFNQLLRCYPNPATSSTILRLPTSTVGRGNFYLTNVTGERLFDWYTFAREVQIDLSKISAGVYFARWVTLGGISLEAKLIVLPR